MYKFNKKEVLEDFNSIVLFKESSAKVDPKQNSGCKSERVGTNVEGYCDSYTNTPCNN